MCLHNNANRGANSPHTGNRFHTESGGLGKRRIGETLQYCILCYWIWSPVLRFSSSFSFSFFFFPISSSICKLGDPVKWGFQEPDREPVAKEKRWERKRDCSGFYFRVKFTATISVIRKKLYLVWHKIMCTNFIIWKLLYYTERKTGNVLEHLQSTFKCRGGVSSCEPVSDKPVPVFSLKHIHILWNTTNRHHCGIRGGISPQISETRKRQWMEAENSVSKINSSSDISVCGVKWEAESWYLFVLWPFNFYQQLWKCMPILDSGFLSVIDIEEQESLFLDQWSSLQNITETSQWHQRPEVFQPIKCSGAPKKHSMAASSKTTEEDGDLF